ncbi:GntR family transcriptional regulator [Streptomyces sp. NBC_01142]|uniref:GntR family transcriptional regulator n=1 Tax=Streptomyces sp. NBC_01142 TaxID=2975865 RepID=UPI002B1D8EFA|nr:GntR family transcriptional regulator [Streptomyces sp. NBC_01142]
MSEPFLCVEADSPIPPYEQIRISLSELILGGHLPPATRLPSVRRLAADLGLAPGHRGPYLPRAGECRTGPLAPGAGTRVARPPETPRPDSVARLAEAARRHVAAGRRLGADDRALLDALTAVLGDSPRSKVDLPIGVKL